MSKIKKVITTLFLSFTILVLPSCSYSPIVANDSTGMSVEPVNTNQEQSIVALAKRSTYMVQILDESGEVVASGSSFLIKNKYLITNHVIDGAHTIKIFSFMGLFLSDATVVDIDVDNDVALLKIDPLIGVSILPLADDTEQLRYLDKVYAIGYPFGDGLAITTGTYQKDSKIFPLFKRISVSIAPGNSGGPAVVYNHKKKRYEVIGIVSAHMAGGGRSFPMQGLISPVNNIHQILQNNKIEVEKYNG